MNRVVAGMDGAAHRLDALFDRVELFMSGGASKITPSPREAVARLPLLPVLAFAGIVSASALIAVRLMFSFPGSSLARLLEIVSGPLFVAIVAAINWPFLVLAYVARIGERKASPRSAGVKIATCCSVMTMLLPNIVMLVAINAGMRQTGSDAGVPLLLPLALIVVPLAGLIGYGVGQLGAAALRRIQ